MLKRSGLILIIVFLLTGNGFSQVRIRLFASQTPESAFITITAGRYELRTYNGAGIQVNRNESVLITRYDGKLAVKTRRGRGFTCDSLVLVGKTGNDLFSLRINDGMPMRQNYSGDLHCYPDLGTLVMINNCDVERYIAGVVRAEGGSNKNKEYLKTQAILARTYMYRHFARHQTDNYNVCDNTHCQAFNGLSSDTLITRAAMETRGLVILASDSSLAVSAFHSNCGGETEAPEDVWLRSMPYLKKIMDPYCLSSKNASWTKSISLSEWIKLLQKSGYKGDTDNPAAFTFSQKTRQNLYRTGSFTVPLSTIREDLNLRSTFFSVIPQGDKIILKGRGYGHGVGLCQEGAMTMAQEGHDFNQIIAFYYSGVIITDIKNAVILPEDASPVAAGGGK
jgi:stage II sporulation protein D